MHSLEIDIMLQFKRPGELSQRGLHSPERMNERSLKLLDDLPQFSLWLVVSVSIEITWAVDFCLKGIALMSKQGMEILPVYVR